jgi:hypothetical protein
MAEFVYAKTFDTWGMSLGGMFGLLPKATIRCGKCGRKFKERLEASRDGSMVGALCDTCGVLNVLRGVSVDS